MVTVKFDLQKIFNLDTFFLVIVLVLLFNVYDVRYVQGRHNMCQEVGRIYLNNGSCMNYDLYQMRYNKTEKKVIKPIKPLESKIPP